MRRAAFALVALVIAASPTAAPGAKRHVLRAHGLAVAAPADWHVTRERLTECSSPAQVMAITDTHGRLGTAARIPHAHTLVLILEDRMWRGNFPPRRRIRVPTLARMGGCCELPAGRGFEVFFRDHGRNLYAFVYAATRAHAQTAVDVLNSLRVGA